MKAASKEVITHTKICPHNADKSSFNSVANTPQKQLEQWRDIFVDTREKNHINVPIVTFNQVA